MNAVLDELADALLARVEAETNVIRLRQLPPVVEQIERDLDKEKVTDQKKRERALDVLPDLPSERKILSDYIAATDRYEAALEAARQEKENPSG